MMRACLFLLVAGLARAAEPAPLVVLAGSTPEPWTAASAARGWEVAAIPEVLPNDAGVRAIEAAIGEARKRTEIDPNRTYLAGQGVSSAAVFYAVSRRPDLWAAALAVGGSPAAAIETNRLFGAGATLAPVLWAVTTGLKAAAPFRARLAEKGFAIEVRTTSMTVSQALDWFASNKREPFPPRIDCETGSLEFARCYWAEITKFDPAQRNDVLPSSRVPPGSGAYLGLGGFGFDVDAPGPGVRVSWLPASYSGPLKLDDRIVAVGGKPLADARAYVEFMAVQQENRLTGITVVRGKQRLRIETRMVIPGREENITARVQAEFLSDTREFQIITRGVAALRLNLPAYWTPCPINWNGNDSGKAASAGCWQLTPGEPARKCEQSSP
jgi:dienelactone hydrolase